ncbi:MAG: S41 family peptidase [Caldilineae bacterium]|nr:MAG: S41 family peptidase [Caldilineae bacterium]
MSIYQRPSSSLPWPYFLAGALTAAFLFLLGAVSYRAVTRAHLSPPAPRVPTRDTAKTNDPSDDLSLYREAWQILEEDFYGEVPSETERNYGAIRGSVETLQDPYTYFIEPEPAGREEEQLQGRFGGIGAYLELREDGRIRLIPMIDRPAALAGIEEGDILVAVDGEPVPVPANLDDVTARVRGPVGTVVRITVERQGQVVDFEIERQEIELPSVSWRILDKEAGIGYIRIERFSALTAREQAQAIQELESQGMTAALVLDLRGNPGGLLDAAIAVSSQYLDGGPVLIERHADGSEKLYQAETSAVSLPSSVAIAVLVDGGTASAAEILAGALQDRGRGTLIGARTFGKGSIQRIHRLSDQSALHVTFAKWFTPNGHQIDGQGLNPDIPVDEAGEGGEQDPFLQAALDHLKRETSHE